MTARVLAVGDEVRFLNRPEAGPGPWFVWHLNRREAICGPYKPTEEKPIDWDLAQVRYSAPHAEVVHVNGDPVDELGTLHVVAKSLDDECARLRSNAWASRSSDWAMRTPPGYR